MYSLTYEEKLQFKLNLNKAISKWLESETIKDNNLGWMPENIEMLMTEAAFSVLEATNALNVYLEKEDLLK